MTNPISRSELAPLLPAGEPVGQLLRPVAARADITGDTGTSGRLRRRIGVPY